MRIAVTADLHWGIHRQGDAATRLMVAQLRADPPDLLILAGDIGAGPEFAPCLELFRELPARRALVPGNHDVWVADDDSRGDSLALYRQQLPALSAAAGFHYLDHGPLVLPAADLAIVGSMNWYDYSWADPAALAQYFPDWRDRLLTKRFTRGRHNDARFVRWPPFDDVSFTKEAVATFERHLREALTAVSRVIVVAHHPPFYGLNFPREGPPTADGLLWDAFAGNRAFESVLEESADRIVFAFCGHTHRARYNAFHGIRGWNVGSDYAFKRLLTLDWPEGTMTEQTIDVRGET